MAKGWKTFTLGGDAAQDSRTRVEKAKADTAFANATRNTRTLKYFELVEQNKKNDKARAEREDQLIQAYEDKKLKSKDLIKEAQAALKKRQKKTEKEASAE